MASLRLGQRDTVARAQAELAGRRDPVEGEREQTVRVDDQADLAGLDVPVGPPPPSGAHLIAEAQRDVVTELLDLVLADVQLEVAEPIHPQDLAEEPTALLARERQDPG